MHEVESYIGTLMAPSLRQVLLSCLLSNSVAVYPVHQLQLLHSGPRTSSTRPTRGPPPPLPPRRIFELEELVRAPQPDEELDAVFRLWMLYCEPWAEA
jgi:hypothetical protein